jgi:hypothetical protein
MSKLCVRANDHYGALHESLAIEWYAIESPTVCYNGYRLQLAVYMNIDNRAGLHVAQRPVI